MPHYYSKYDKKLYSKRSLLACLALKELTREDYRDIADWLDCSDSILYELGFEHSPHYTTLHKFSQRILHSYLYRIVLQLVSSFRSNVLAVDSTGFSQTNRSLYYDKIDGKCRKYVKLNAAVLVKQRLIADYRIGPMHDNRAMQGFMQQAKQHNVKTVVADKGYDSENNHVLGKELGMRTIIPVRKTVGTRYRTKHRNRLRKNFPEKLYHQRSLAESVFSSMKRTLSSALRARKPSSQQTELQLRVLVYNVLKTALFIISTTPNTQKRLLTP